jgi:hypothetical protein
MSVSDAPKAGAFELLAAPESTADATPLAAVLDAACSVIDCRDNRLWVGKA